MENNQFLETIHITDFLSLHDVKLPLKPLTILVGPNASGKSNVLSGLELIKEILRSDNLPPSNFIQSHLWAGKADHIRFQLQAEINDKTANYLLELEPKDEGQLLSEQLTVGEVKVISIKKGKGEVRDEDSQNQIAYNSKKLALKSAGDYGNKPVTNALTQFIRQWQFYDFKPYKMKGSNITFSGIPDELILTIIPDELIVDGSIVKFLLSYWHEHDNDRFETVNEAIKNCSNIGIEYRDDNGDSGIYLLEGYDNPIPLERASDGTLRLLAYHTLLAQEELPSLIAIEEPERNLHPVALLEVSRIVEQLAERTQVIITTHSSQLLDSFNADNLADSLGVLLLRNSTVNGTEIINLKDVQADREALSDWIDDFGIGSAIFHSELLQDIMEE